MRATAPHSYEGLVNAAIEPYAADRDRLSAIDWDSVEWIWLSRLLSINTFIMVIGNACKLKSVKINLARLVFVYKDPKAGAVT